MLVGEGGSFYTKEDDQPYFLSISYMIYLKFYCGMLCDIRCCVDILIDYIKNEDSSSDILSSKSFFSVIQVSEKA